MKTLKNIFFSALLIASMLWVIAEAPTDGGKIIRIIVFFISAVIWCDQSPIGRKLTKKI